jgi:hypothetical protein
MLKWVPGLNQILSNYADDLKELADANCLGNIQDA